MGTLKIQQTVNEIERNMAELAPYRNAGLFNKFLPNGYRSITLSTVPELKASELLRAKLCLGTLITLYDDFADRPSQSNPQLLEALYRLDFNSGDLKCCASLRHQKVLAFSQTLFASITGVLERQPNYRRLKDILDFDLKQFYSANQYSSLLMATPSLKNSHENRLYTHHNMGMVMVAMMDLMAIEKVVASELGSMREVFLLGQRMGRIFNVLTTRMREAEDGDMTGEIACYSGEQEIRIAELNLHKEVLDLRSRILEFDHRITTFSVKAYVDGLDRVQTLHEKMTGTI
jgi:hypothetical protein